MFCKNCGAILPDGTFECPVCHTMLNENTAGNTNYNQNAYQQNPYQPPYQNQQNYNANWQMHDMEYRHMIEKGDTAKILALLGLVLGIIASPILGWVLGGIALSNANQVFAFTGNKDVQSTISLSKWALIVSSIIAVLQIVAIAVVMFLFSAFSQY